MEWLQTYIAQIAGLLAAFIVGWAAKYNLTLDAAQITSLLITVFVAVERLVAAHSNPTNAATPQARRAARVMLDQHGEPSAKTAMHSYAQRSGPVSKDD